MDCNHPAPGVFTLSQVLSLEECRDHIASSEASGYAVAPITTPWGFEMRPEIRNNTRVILDDHRIAKDLWQRVRDHVPPEIDGKPALGLNERFRYYRYDPGEKFALHTDGYYQRDNGERSRLTMILYLNDGFSGGETRIDLKRQSVKITPTAGDALFFIHHLLHEGVEVRQGRKYVLRTDVMYGA